MAPSTLQLTTALVAGLLPALVSAGQLKINNWCSETVYIYQSHCGKCNKGLDDRCDWEGGRPWAVPQGSIHTIDMIGGGCGASVKISRGDASFRSGILQYEYNVADGIYWDLSDLDGSGNGLVGTPFRNANVKVSPTGPGEGQGTCVKIRCPAGQVCLDSYQHPDDPNTKWCPLNTGPMWLDLCQPSPNFNNRRDVPGATATNAMVKARYPIGANGTVPFFPGGNSTAPVPLVPVNGTVPVNTTVPVDLEDPRSRRAHALNIPVQYEDKYIEESGVNIPNVELDIPVTA
ncbi:hypothetical protein V8F20_004137 [Naviculisporaceae sp. PSN 640]